MVMAMRAAEGMGILRNIPEISFAPKTTSGGRADGAAKRRLPPALWLDRFWSGARKEWNFPYRFRSAFRAAPGTPRPGGGPFRSQRRSFRGPARLSRVRRRKIQKNVEVRMSAASHPRCRGRIGHFGTLIWLFEKFPPRPVRSVAETKPLWPAPEGP